MKPHHIAYTNRAKKQLLDLPKKIQTRMVSAIDELGSPDADIKAKKLQGRKKEEPIYRIRSGDYRALYTVDENGVIIHYVGHRKDAYKRGRI